MSTVAGNWSHGISRELADGWRSRPFVADELQAGCIVIVSGSVDAKEDHE